MFLCHNTIRLGLVVFHVVMLRNMVCSELDYLFKDFSLDVTCKGNKNQPGFGAKIVGVDVNYKSQKEGSESASEGSGDDSKEDKGDLFEEFIKSMGQEMCQDKKSTIFNFFNETKPFIVNGDILKSDQPQISNETEDDDMQATIDRLRVGVAVGTILGFVFGVLITGVLILVYTKKMHRHRNSKYSSEIDTQRKTQVNEEIADYKYDHANYTYCDANDEICQRPTESSSKSQNSEESHKYQDCNLNTYNHLNENDCHIAITNQQYDHIRNACADSIQSDGEYRMLEPANSMQEGGILPKEKPTNDMSKPSENNYFELENVKCQATNPEAYFVLEKDTK